MRWWPLLVASSLTMAAMAPASAQPRASASGPGEVALDLTVGYGHGAGAAPDYARRGLVSAAALLSFRLSHRADSHAMAALVAGADMLWNTSMCLADIGFCRDYPSIGQLGVLGGWASHGAQDRGVRLLTGPVYANLGDPYNGLGWLARADAAAPLGGPLSFVWRAQVLLAPRERLQRAQVYSWGMGLRLR